MKQKLIEVNPDRPWFLPGSGWPEGWDSTVEVPLVGLGQVLADTAARCPDNNAFWFLGETMTYGELNSHVDSLAASLYRLGVRKGDVVALILPNSFQYVISYYACARLGAWVSGVNPTYKPAEVLHQLRLVNARVVIVLDALYESILAPVMDKSPAELLICTNVGDFLPWWKKTLGKKLGKIPQGAVPPRAFDFMNLLKNKEKPPVVELDPQTDVATLIMTGGTTGVPKAAMLSHFNCVANVYQAKDYLSRDNKSFWVLGILPFFHSFGMSGVMNLCVVTGYCGILFPKPPAMKELCEVLERLVPRAVDLVFPGAEVLFQKMADYLEANPGRHKLENRFSVCVSGAGPLHRPVQEKFERVTGATLREGYGLSECSPLVSLMPLKGDRTFGSIGIPFKGTDWAILDMETCTRRMEPGEDNIGELCIHGPQMMLGYYNNQEDSAECLVEFEGRTWLKTGDLGYMDEFGYVTLKDRKKQLIKYKGYSVFPNEVEQLVCEHPGVKEVAAYGIPDPEVNEVIKIWVVPEPSWADKLTAEELLSWCRGAMTHYKVPRYVEFLSELPKTAVGKVQRRQLAEADPLYNKA